MRQALGSEGLIRSAERPPRAVIGLMLGLILLHMQSDTVMPEKKQEKKRIEIDLAPE